jgi:hypothetical protein
MVFSAQLVDFRVASWTCRAIAHVASSTVMRKSVVIVGYS